VALLAFLHDLTVTAPVVLAAFFGAVESFLGPAYQALIPEVVPEDRLHAANALQMLSQSTSSIAGAAIGAWLYSWGRAGTAFAFDALNFVVSAFASALLRVPDRTVAVSASIWDDSRRGWRYIRQATWLWVGIVVATVVNAVGNAPYVVLLPAVLRHLHLGVGSMGLTLAITAATAVVANLVLGQVPMLPRRAMLMFALWSLIGVGTVLVGVAPSYPLIALAAILRGITSAGETLWASLVQGWVPREYLGG
jgi:MFS family permease